MKLPTNDDELDNEFETEEDYTNLLSGKNGYESQAPFWLVTPVVSIIAWTRYFYMYRRLEFVLAIILAFSILIALTGFVVEIEGYETGPHHKHAIVHDYSGIQSKMELNIGDIEHWCLDGKDDSCPMCVDPLVPSTPQGNEWRGIYLKNKGHASEIVEKEFDVIFLGDGITEQRSGTLGGVESEELNAIKRVFDSQFSKENGGRYDGLALGISGNTSPNLLWRVIRNEVPTELKSKIFWITIGINDLTTTMCSEQVAVMGILRVVEELHDMRPDSTIVINSILPKATSKNGKILDSKFVHNKYYDAIQQVNSRLENFARKQGNRVRFYDADPIFVSKSKGGKKITMNSDLFSDAFHPNADGHRRLGEGQMQVIANILAHLETDEIDPSDVDLSTTIPDILVYGEEPPYYYYYNDDDYLDFYDMWEEGDDWF